MHKLLLSAATAAALTLTASAAHAFPASSTLTQPAGAVVQVRDLCGIGWHRGPYGVCRRNGYVYGPYAVYVPPPPPPPRCWRQGTPYGARRVCAW